MGLLIECPVCRKRIGIKKGICTCGKNVRKDSGKCYWIEYYLDGSRVRERIGFSKLAAEKYCQFYAKELGVKVSILRYFHVFGPRQDYRGEAGVINIFLSRVLKGEAPTIFGTGEQIRCFTYVEDVVAANLLLASNDDTVGEVYNVASKTRISVKDLADLLISKYGNGYNGSLKPQFGPARIGENLKPIPHTSKIESLGFLESVSFEEGLDNTKSWIENDVAEETY